MAFPPRTTCRFGMLPTLALLAAAAVPAFAADGPAGAEWLPADAVLHVEATRPELLLDRVLGEGFQTYLKAVPPYQKYIESREFKQQSAHVKLVATLLDTDWEKGLRNLAGGGAIFSVSVAKGKPQILLALTPKDAAFLVKSHAKLVELARADAAGKGNPDPVKTNTYRGVVAYSVAPQEAHAIVKDVLVVANDPDALKAVIDKALDGAKAAKPAAELAARRAKAETDKDTLIWAYLDMNKLRSIDAKFAMKGELDAGATFLFGSWIDALRKTPWVSASIHWGESNLTADVAMPAKRGDYADTFRRYLPPAGQGAPAPLAPKGVIGNFALWRDFSSIWEVRTEIFPPQAVQNLAQLDSFAGQFFGGRDFGSGVLASLGTNWRVVAAEQDYAKMKPVPDVKLPAFALVIDLKPDDDDFAQRLRVAFTSFVGLANLGAAQTKAPPLEIGSETVDGITIQTTRFLEPRVDKTKDKEKASKIKAEPVHQRHNFSPSAVQVGDTFVLSSSIGLARDLIPLLKEPKKPRVETAALEIDGAALARLVDVNKQRLVMQNMLEKGNDKAKAEVEVEVLGAILRYLGKASLTASDAQESLKFRLNFDLGSK